MPAIYPAIRPAIGGAIASIFDGFGAPSLSAQVAALFAGGMKGIWRESSVITTLYQNFDGLNVSAPSNPIALALSKDQALALGPELMPSLASGAGWTPGAGWAITGGQAVATAATSTLVGGPALSVGKVYLGRMNVVSRSAGSISYPYDSTNPIYATAPGLYEWKFQADAAFAPRIFGIGFTGALDLISVCEVLGNHQSQATTQSRPLYQVSPPRPVFDGIDDVLNTTFPVALGTNCTVGRYVPGTGVVILTGQNIGTTFADSVTSGPLVVLDGPLTAGQTATLTAYLTQQGTLP